MVWRKLFKIVQISDNGCPFGDKQGAVKRCEEELKI